MHSVERGAADEAAPVGHFDHFAPLTIGSCMRTDMLPVGEYLPHDAVITVVLVRQIHVAAPILDREHPVRRVVAVFSHAVFRIRHFPEARAPIVLVADRPADVVLKPGDS